MTFFFKSFLFSICYIAIVFQIRLLPLPLVVNQLKENPMIFCILNFFYIQMELFGLCFPLVFRWLFPHSHTYTHSHIHPHPPTTAYETR